MIFRLKPVNNLNEDTAPTTLPHPFIGLLVRAASTGTRLYINCTLYINCILYKNCTMWIDCTLTKHCILTLHCILIEHWTAPTTLPHPFIGLLVRAASTGTRLYTKCTLYINCILYKNCKMWINCTLTKHCILPLHCISIEHWTAIQPCLIPS